MGTLTHILHAYIHVPVCFRCVHVHLHVYTHVSYTSVSSCTDSLLQDFSQIHAHISHRYMHTRASDTQTHTHIHTSHIDLRQVMSSISSFVCTTSRHLLSFHPAVVAGKACCQVGGICLLGGRGTAGRVDCEQNTTTTQNTTPS